MDNMAAEHVYSHRGSAGQNEHSFITYDDAIALGSHFIEQDVVMSKDGVLFVAHSRDAVVMTGTSALYSVLTAEEIEQLRTHTGNKILRLSEVFERYGKNVHYVIELKRRDDETLKAFEELIDQYDIQDVVVFQSTNTNVLKEFDTKYPDMELLYLSKSQTYFDQALDMSYIDIISVPALSDLMTEKNCIAAHEHGKQFNIWTLDTEEMIRKAIDIGADTYFTNNTELALDLEREYGIYTRNDNRD